MMLTFKHSPPNKRVKMHLLSPQSVLAMGVLREICQELSTPEKRVEARITSISDGNHGGKSKHYRGDGWDYGIITVDGEEDQAMDNYVRGQLGRILGRDFDVVNETGEKRHTHVEYDPKDGNR